MKDFLNISDHSHEELRHLLDVAKRVKKQHKETGRNDPLLAGKSLAMIFEKPSLRTRVSFAVGMTQLGGAGVLLRAGKGGPRTRAAPQDLARPPSLPCGRLTGPPVLLANGTRGA